MKDGKEEKMDKVTEGKISYYMNLPYTVEITKCEEDVYFARIPKSPDISRAQGKTHNEAYEMIRNAMMGWIIPHS